MSDQDDEHFWDRQEAYACYDTAVQMIRWIKGYADIDPARSALLLAQLSELISSGAASPARRDSSTVAANGDPGEANT